MNNTVYDQMDRFMPVLFGLSLIAMLFLIVSLIRRLRSRVKDVKSGVRHRRRYPGRSFTLFLATIICMVFISAAMKEGSKAEILFYLDHIDPKTLSVQVNGGKATDPNAVIDVLRTMPDIPAHHTHAVGGFTIVIDDQIGGLTLRLGRDSDRPQEYWVFYPRYRYTTHNEVYRINTALFDGIK